MKCTIKGLDIHYHEAGSGTPILLIHGLSQDHRVLSGCMEPIFKHQTGYRRIYVDLPGMGLSQSDSSSATSDAVLTILLAFIDTVLQGQNFLLAGNSYGGYLCAAIAKKMPQRVQGLFLLCPMLVPDDTKRTLPEHVVLKKDEDFLAGLDETNEDVQDFKAFTIVHTQYVFDRMMHEIVPGLDLGNDDFQTELRKNENYALSYCIHEKDYTFHQPSLILTGKQDAGTGYKDAWDVLGCYPRATYAALDTAGHNLQIEQPMLFEAFVTEWLKRTAE